MTADRTRDWNVELQTVHHRLEAALEAAPVALGRGHTDAILSQELRVPCITFCSALTSHHEREDVGLFPRIANDEPDLRPVVEQLMEAHLVLAARLADLRRLLDDESATPDDILDGLDATKAFMKSHFADEELRLARALDSLRADVAQRTELLGQVRAPY
jgi:hypothetical protein